ncbi:MAG: hypothetical protein KAQ69_08085 [Spirochaetales bacterium]|nr:hypothetical protein [Spirochaetales bacterium]
MRNLETDLRIHSRNRLELKTSIPVNEPGIEKYSLQLYLFSPAQLNIRKNTYSRTSAVFADFNVRTRFSSPNLSLDTIIDPGCDLSPLYRISHMLQQSFVDKEAEHSIVYEFQTLVNNFRREMKDTIQLVQNESEKPSAATVCTNKISKTLHNIEPLMGKFRTLHASFLEPRITESLRTAFLWCDEALSSIVIESLVGLFTISKRVTLDGDLIKKIEQKAAAEEQHRKEFQYITDLTSTDSHAGEAVSYRTGMLKKWSQSALYIRTEESRLPKNIGHIFAGTAAATAMTFAVLASLYAQKVFSRNTLPWALIIILAYVFKDRIKEVMRDVLGRGIPKLLADQITRFRDPATGARVGNAKERIDFLRMRDIPNRIRNLRTEKPNPFRNLLPEEDVIFYSRDILINSRKLKRSHTRLEAINEIIRIRFDKWFKEMDDPEDTFYRIDSGKTKVFEGKKVYHLHLIIELSEKKDRSNDRLFHYEVILSKKGILRIITL